MGKFINCSRVGHRVLFTQDDINEALAKNKKPNSLFMRMFGFWIEVGSGFEPL